MSVMARTGQTLPRADLLQGVECRDTLAHILDLAEQALRTWAVVTSEFLAPADLAEILPRLQRLTELSAFTWGGYPQAERQRLAIGRTDIMESTAAAEAVPLALLEVRGNFLFDTASHRDFLGAVLGTGIVREMIGDIVVLGEQGAQILSVPEMVPHLEMSLVQVRTVPVQTRLVSLDQLKVRSPRTKAITTVEASLRLDAVASAGFSTSRSKMAADIETGDVKVNWRTITQASRSVQSGDLITIRGRGRVEVGSIAETKKGRYRIELMRYL